MKQHQLTNKMEIKKLFEENKEKGWISLRKQSMKGELNIPNILVEIIKNYDSSDEERVKRMGEVRKERVDYIEVINDDYVMVRSSPNLIYSISKDKCLGKAYFYGNNDICVFIDNQKVKIN